MSCLRGRRGMWGWGELSGEGNEGWQQWLGQKAHITGIHLPLYPEMCFKMMDKSGDVLTSQSPESVPVNGWHSQQVGYTKDGCRWPAFSVGGVHQIWPPVTSVSSDPHGQTCKDSTRACLVTHWEDWPAPWKKMHHLLKQRGPPGAEWNLQMKSNCVFPHATRTPVGAYVTLQPFISVIACLTRIYLIVNANG